MIKNQASTVDEYISGFNEDIQDRLIQMRDLILKLAPDSEESLAYGMPAYKLYKKPLVYFGGYEHHIGFYATPNAHEQFKESLCKYKQGKGSVQFPHNQILPIELIQKIVEFRINENAEKVKTKSKK